MITYTKEKFTTDIPVKEYIRDYVNIPEFAAKCRECPNYASSWSCPPFDFNPLDYWKQYSDFHIEAVCIYFSKEDYEKSYPEEELTKIISQIMQKEKSTLTAELYSMESADAISLSAGSCNECTYCTRADDKPCIHPEKLRYSIESLGGNVGLTCSKLFHKTLDWCEAGKLPEKLMLICGLLSK